MRIPKKAQNYPLDIQILYQFKLEGSCPWKDNDPEVLIPTYGGKIPYRTWRAIIRDLRDKGYLQSCLKDFEAYKPYYPNYNQKSITVYSLSGLGRELLKELGL